MEMCEADGFTPSRRLADRMFQIGLEGNLSIASRNSGSCSTSSGITRTSSPSRAIPRDHASGDRSRGARARSGAGPGKGVALMAVEWAWVGRQRPVALADRGIFLPADGGCTVAAAARPDGIAHGARLPRLPPAAPGRQLVRVPRLVNHGQPLGVLAAYQVAGASTVRRRRRSRSAQ